MDDNLKVFATRLRQLRKEKDLSQDELAKMIDCPSSLISYYENCQREPGFSNLLALCEVLDETPDYLMGITSARKLKKIAE